MTTQKLTMDRQGRLTIPSSLRAELGLQQGHEFAVRVERGGLVLESRQAALARLREMFAGVDVDGFLGERRDQARREWDQAAPGSRADG